MRARRGNTLVSVIAAFAIIAILAVVVTTGGFGVGKSSRKDGLGTTIQGSARAQALDVNCRSNLNQIRLSIQAATATDEESLPSTLADLRLGQSMVKCPIGGEAYEYDPTTGVVSCPHPGHGKY